MSLLPLVGLVAALSKQKGTTSPSQTPSPSPFHEFVQVTATRRAEPAVDVPANVTVISGAELADRGATDLRSALSLVSGVDIASGGDNGPAASVPEFWGLKEFDAFLLVVDGTPWGGAFNPSLATLDLHDVDRIEVVHGPAPVLFGATSFVGVIQVIHRDAAAASGAVTLHAGSHDSGGGSGTFRLPAWGGFASSLSADFARRGYEDERTSWNKGHVLWRNRLAVQDGSFRFDIDAQRLRQEPASPTPRQDAALTTLVPIDSNQNPAGAFVDEDRFFVSTGYERNLSRGTWSTQLSFTRSSGDNFRGFLRAVSDEDGTENAAGFRSETSQTDLYFDTHLATSQGEHVSAVFGLDYLFGKARAEGDVFDYFVNLDGSGAPPSSDIPAGPVLRVDDSRNFAGLYANAEWTPAPRWRLEAGARLNVTREERGDGEGEAAGAGEEEASADTVRLSGGAGAVWTAWQRDGDSLHVFANAKSSFKPAAVDLFLVEEESEGEGILEPETATSFEAGAKSRLLGGALSLEASGFFMNFHNLVIAQSIGGLPALRNAGSERLKGIDMSASYRVDPVWSVRGTLAVHSARFLDFLTEFDGVPTQLRGKRLEMSPHTLGSLGIVHAPARGLVATVDLLFVGSRFLNKRNTALADEYATWSASAGYRSGRWEIRAHGRNLNDRRDPVAESELGDAQYYRLQNRRFDVSASVSF